MYGLPNGFLQAKVVDTSDILSKGAKRRTKRKSEEELLEECLAAQILAGRREKALAAQVIAEEALNKSKLATQEKAKRVRLLMMFLLAEEE